MNCSPIVEELLLVLERLGPAELPEEDEVEGGGEDVAVAHLKRCRNDCAGFSQPLVGFFTRLADVLAVRHADEVAVAPHEGGLAAQADHGANVAHRLHH